MDKHTFVLNGIIFFYIIQRIAELIISNENEKWLVRENEAQEVDPLETKRMRIFHSLWFISLIVESNLKKEFQTPAISLGLYLILILGMLIRFHTMEKLKKFWTVKVLAMKNHIIANTGLYQYYRHPNYAVVVIELICLPLLFKAYVTMILFSIINLYILSKRIELEENTLMKQSNYRDLFYGKKLAIVAILVLGGVNSFAEDLHLNYKTYGEAKKSASYIKFQSESTKLGLLTTSFDGFVKNIKLHYVIDGNVIKNLDAVLAGDSLDTDVNARNDKLYKEILDVEKFPSILVSVAGPVQLKEGDQSVEMIFQIKDKKITKRVAFSLTKNDKHFLVKGHTALGLKEMGLPDPSIAIAKVRDEFDFDFAFIL